MRVAIKEMAYSTFNSYRKILNRSWRPKLGKREITSVRYSELEEIVAEQGWKTKKTYNNGISPLRCAFRRALQVSFHIVYVNLKLEKLFPKAFLCHRFSQLRGNGAMPGSGHTSEPGSLADA